MSTVKQIAEEVAQGLNQVLPGLNKPVVRKLSLGAFKQMTLKSHRIFFNATAGMALNQFRASQF